MKTKNPIHVLAACAIGTLLEWYDFSLFAYLAPILAKNFFPLENSFTSLLLTYSIFAVGFLVRPIGAICFGHLGDRIGRRKVLLTSIVLITAATGLIGLLPTYSQIGIFAPIFLIILRLIQGIAIGGETTGAGVLIIESINHTKRGFLSSLVWSCSGIGILCSSIVIFLIQFWLPLQDLMNWGWRIPFLLGILTGCVGYYLRSATAESISFQLLHANNKIIKYPLWTAITQYKREIITALSLYVLSAIITYLIFVYMPVYVAKVTTITFSTAMFINTLMMAISISLTPVIGYYSDLFGRRLFLFFGAIGLFLLAYPLFYYISHGSVHDLIIAQFILTLVGACYQGAITSAVLEMFPSNIRFSAAAFTYNLSFSLFGGTTPAIALFLIGMLHRNTAPSFYLMAGCIVAMLAIAQMRETFRIAAYEFHSWLT